MLAAGPWWTGEVRTVQVRTGKIRKGPVKPESLTLRFEKKFNSYHIILNLVVLLIYMSAALNFPHFKNILKKDNNIKNKTKSKVFSLERLYKFCI